MSDNKKPVLEIGAQKAPNFDSNLEGMAAKVNSTAKQIVEAGKQTETTFDPLLKGAELTAKETARAIRGLSASIKRDAIDIQASLENATKSRRIEINAAVRGIDISGIKPQIEALKALEAQQGRVAEAQRAAAVGASQAALVNAKAFDTMGLSVKGYNAALRQVPAQFTDIIVSLQGGQAPLTVLLQQGGQLKDVFGGVGNAARALGSYILGLVTPFTVAGAAIAAIGFAYFIGSQEAGEYNKAIILSGNASGTTVSQLQGYAQAIGKVTGSQHEAAGALAEFAQSGKVGTENLQAFTQAAIQFEHATGTAVSKTVEQFKELAKAPVEASVKLDEQINFLTVSLYKQIKALEDQGKATEAADLAQKAFSDTIAGRTGQIVANVGLIQAAWIGVKKAISSAANEFLNIGRTSTLADRRVDIEKRIAQITPNSSFVVNNSDGAAFGTGRGRGSSAKDQGEIARLQAELAIVNGIEFAQKETAKTEAERLRLKDGFIAFDKQGEQFATKKQKLEKEITKATIEGNDLVKAGLLTQVELNTRLSNIREKFKDKSSGAAGAGQNEVAGIRAKVIEAEKYYQQLLLQEVAQKKLTEGEKLVIKIQEELKTSISGVSRAQKERALVEAKNLAVADKRNAIEEAYQKSIEKGEAALNRQVDAVRNQTDSILEQAKGQETANANFGKSKTAIEQSTLATLKHQLAEADAGSDFIRAAPAYVAALEEKTKAQERFVKALQQTEFKQTQVKLTESGVVAQQETETLQLELSLVTETQKVRDRILGQRRIDLQLAKELRAIEKLNLGTGPDSDAKREELKAKANANYVIESNNEANKVVRAEWQKTADAINTALTDALLAGFESGKNFAKSLRDSIVNLFKNLILRPTISALVGGASGALGLPQLASAATGGASGAGNIASLLSNGITLAGSSVAAIGSSVLTGIKAGFSGTSLVAAKAAYTAAGQVGVATGLGAGSSIGAFFADPTGIALAVAAVVAVLSSGHGEERFGSAYVTGSDGKAVRQQGASLFANEDGLKLFDSVQANIKNTLETVGSKASLTGFVAGFESSKNGKGFAYAGGEVNGVAFGENKGRDGGQFAFHSLTPAEAFKSYADQLNQATIQALQAATDLPKIIQDQLSGPINNAEDQNKVLQSINGIVVAMAALRAGLNDGVFKNLHDLSFSAAAGLVQAAGGFEKLQASLATYYQEFYTSEEQRQQTIININKATAGSGLDAATATRDSFRKIVESQDLTTESGQKTYAALLGVAGAFASITPAADKSTGSIKATTAAIESTAEAYIRLTNITKTGEQQAQARIGLEQQLIQLTGTADQIRTAAIAGLDDFNVSLYDLIETSKEATKQNGIAQGLDRQISTVLGDTAALRLLDIAGMSAENVLRYDKLELLKKEKSASDAATAAAATLAATNKSLTDQIDILSGKETTRSIALRDAGDDSTRNLLRTINALEDAKTAQDNYNTSLANAKTALANAQSSVNTAQDKVKAIQSQGTDQYLSALDRVAQAQKSITDIQLAAQDKIAQASIDAAQKMRDLGKSLRDFISGEISGNAANNFASTLAAAQGGNTDAIGGLGSAAKGAIDAALASAHTNQEFNTQRNSILAAVAGVAATAEASKSNATLSTTPDPLVAAQAELAKSQAELAQALIAATAIGASLTKSPIDLISQFASAQTELSKAAAELTAATQVLADIERNTKATVASVNTLGSALTVELSITARSEITKLITFIGETTGLTADQKYLALLTTGSISRTIDLIVDGTTLTETNKQLALTTTNTIIKTISLVANSTLTEENKTLALQTSSSVDKTIVLIANSTLSADNQALAFLATNSVVKTIALVAQSLLSDENKTLALQANSSVSKTIVLIATSTLSADNQALAFLATNSVTKTISIVANSLLSAENKTLAFQATSSVDKTIVLIAASTISPENQALAFLATSSVVKTIALVSTSTLSAENQTLALLLSSSVTKTISLIVAADLTEENRRLALTATGSVDKTISIIATSTLSEANKTLALQTSGSIDRTIVLSLTSLLSAGDQAILSQASSEITKVINLTATSTISEADKTLVLLGAGAVTRTINAALGTTLSEADKTLVLTTTGNVTRTINAALGTNDPTALALALTNSSTLIRTIEASGGLLTEDQRKILTALNGSSLATLTVTGTTTSLVTYDPNDPIRSVFDSIKDLTYLISVSSTAIHSACAYTATLIAAWMARSNLPQVVFAHDPGGGNVYAKGGAFTNSIVDRPTYFNESLMGEAGPEAILPLKRGADGSLGVSASFDYSNFGRGNDSSAALVAEIRSLREDNQAQAQAMVNLQKRMTKLIERWDGTGLPEVRVTA